MGALVLTKSDNTLGWEKKSHKDSKMLVYYVLFCISTNVGRTTMWSHLGTANNTYLSDV